MNIEAETRLRLAQFLDMLVSGWGNFNRRPKNRPWRLRDRLKQRSPSTHFTLIITLQDYPAKEIKRGGGGAQHVSEKQATVQLGAYVTIFLCIQTLILYSRSKRCYSSCQHHCIACSSWPSDFRTMDGHAERFLGYYVVPSAVDCIALKQTSALFIPFAEPLPALRSVDETSFPSKPAS